MPADETNLAAGLFFFSPIGKKFILRTAGAWTDPKDLAFRDARPVQNGCIEIPQIQVHLILSVSNTGICRAGPLIRQGLRNVSADLVATAIDRRA